MPSCPKTALRNGRVPLLLLRQIFTSCRTKTPIASGNAQRIEQILYFLLNSVGKFSFLSRLSSPKTTTSPHSIPMPPCLQTYPPHARPPILRMSLSCCSAGRNLFSFSEQLMISSDIVGAAQFSREYGWRTAVSGRLPFQGCQKNCILEIN